jgi:phosphoribosylformylglycinamidine cyclo-ligase
VERIAPLVAATHSTRVLEGIGGFGALFRAQFDGLSDPVLVSGTDGVGTKSQLARRLGVFDTLGFDLVAMCVDDIACIGAEPLFFLDYVAVGKQRPEQIEELVGGIARACSEAECALIGGETAEHPGVMAPDDVDLAGFVVGVVDASARWGAHRVCEGDVLLGLNSPNLRSNGFSLVRAIYSELLDDARPLGADGRAWLMELLQPSVLYSPKLRRISETRGIHAAAHITGGGLRSNLSRVIPSELVAVIDQSSWEVPEVFRRIAVDGQVDDEEMFATFNMGIGMVLVVSSDSAAAINQELSNLGCGTVVLGEVAQRRASDAEEGARWKS